MLQLCPGTRQEAILKMSGFTLLLNFGPFWAALHVRFFDTSTLQHLNTSVLEYLNTERPKCLTTKTPKTPEILEPLEILN